jgi:hypothetical protein
MVVPVLPADLWLLILESLTTPSAAALATARNLIPYRELSLTFAEHPALRRLALLLAPPAVFASSLNFLAAYRVGMSVTAVDERLQLLKTSHALPRRAEHRRELRAVYEQLMQQTTLDLSCLPDHDRRAYEDFVVCATARLVLRLEGNPGIAMLRHRLRCGESKLST